ncbi:MAG: TRAP transporter small permease [Actinomycetaceae bacterium]|nr:TRAP transporter small permease [Actinomycetaceae bacterium]
MLRIKITLDKTLEWFCVALFVVLVVDVTWQVFTRQVLNDPSGWSEELAKYVFIWLGLFGSSLVFGERGHIAVDFAVRKTPEQIQRIIAIFVQISIIVFAIVVLIQGGYKVSVLAWNQNLTGLPVNVGWLYVALPITGFLTVFYSLFHLVGLIRGSTAALDTEDPDVI